MSFNVIFLKFRWYFQYTLFKIKFVLTCLGLSLSPARSVNESVRLECVSQSSCQSLFEAIPIKLEGLLNPIKLDVFRCVPCYIGPHLGLLMDCINDPEYLL